MPLPLRPFEGGDSVLVDGAPLAATIAAGLLCGAFNGLVSLRWRLPSFIVTLGMLEMARGGAHALTKSQTQYIGAAVEGIAGASVFGLSLPFLMALVIVIAAQLALSRTVFGRYLVAIGTNEEAVRLSGIDPRRAKLGVFLLSGALVALAAIIDTSRFQSANPNAGSGFELQAIAAAVIGGTSLMGGRGSVISTFFAVLNHRRAEFGARRRRRALSGRPILSGNAMTIATLCEQRGVPFVMDVAAADDITRKGFKFTFRVFPTTSKFADSMLFYMTRIMKDKNS